MAQPYWLRRYDRPMKNSTTIVSAGMPAVWETDSDMLRRTSGGWPTKRSSIRLTPCPARNALTNAGKKVHQYYGPFLPKTANCSQTVISATSSPHREPLAVGRKFARYQFYQFYMVAEMLWQSRKRWGRITDISPAGMFIEIPDAPCLDASFSPSSAQCSFSYQLHCSPGGSQARSLREQFEALLQAVAGRHERRKSRIQER
jgi:hypothetical protein